MDVIGEHFGHFININFQLKPSNVSNSFVLTTTQIFQLHIQFKCKRRLRIIMIVLTEMS